MANTPARVPFARVQPNAVDDPMTQRAISAVDLNLQRVERFTAGLYQPRALVASRSPYTVQSTDWLLLCDCTAGAITLTFPAAARVDGFFVMVIKTDSSANAVTLSGTFNGVVNPTLAKQYQSKTINAGNGAYYFTPTISPADIPSGTFPGNYVIAGTLEVDGNFSVNTNKFTVTASSGNTTIAGTLGVTGLITATGSLALAANKLIGKAVAGDINTGLGWNSNDLYLANSAGTGIINFASAGSVAMKIVNTAITMGDGSATFAAAQTFVRTSNPNNVVFGIKGAASQAVDYFEVASSTGTVQFAVTSTGGASVLGDLAINTSKFTVTASSGNFAAAGNGTVSGTMKVTGGAGGSLAVSGDYYNHGVLTVAYINGGGQQNALTAQHQVAVLAGPTGNVNALGAGSFVCSFEGQPGTDQTSGTVDAITVFQAGDTATAGATVTCTRNFGTHDTTAGANNAVIADNGTPFTGDWFIWYPGARRSRLATFFFDGAEIYRNIDTDFIRVSGGNAAGTGANISVFGSTHVSVPSQMFLNGANGVTVAATGHKLAFFGGTPQSKLTVTGSRGGNAALTDFLTKMATYGVITDGTSP